MDDLLGLLRWPVTPLWIMALAFIVALWRGGPDFMARWNERRRDRAKIEGEQYDRLAARSQRLEERCDRLEDSEEECQRKLANALGRIAELEGYNDGKGKARQDAAGIVAVERLTDRSKGKEGA